MMRERQRQRDPDRHSTEKAAAARRKEREREKCVGLWQWQWQPVATGYCLYRFYVVEQPSFSLSVLLLLHQRLSRSYKEEEEEEEEEASLCFRQEESRQDPFLWHAAAAASAEAEQAGGRPDRGKKKVIAPPLPLPRPFSRCKKSSQIKVLQWSAASASDDDHQFFILLDGLFPSSPHLPPRARRHDLPPPFPPARFFFDRVASRKKVEEGEKA